MPQAGIHYTPEDELTPPMEASVPVSGSALDIADTSRWYCGAQNDAPFIINRPPRPSTDDAWHDRPDGPTLAICMAGDALTLGKEIADAHNKVVDDLMQEVDRLTDYAIGLTMIAGDAGDATKQALKSLGKRQELESKIRKVQDAMRGIELLDGAQRRLRFALIHDAIGTRVSG